MNNHRQEERQAIEAFAEVEDDAGRSWPGDVINISTNGALVALQARDGSPVDLAVRQTVKVHVYWTAPGQEDALTVERDARIRHIGRDDRVYVGLRLAIPLEDNVILQA